MKYPNSIKICSQPIELEDTKIPQGLGEDITWILTVISSRNFGSYIKLCPWPVPGGLSPVVANLRASIRVYKRKGSN